MARELRDYESGWQTTPDALQRRQTIRNKMKSDEHFSKFVDHMQHAPHAEIEARLKRALAAGEFQMQDQYGRVIPAEELDMDTFKVTFPVELTEDSQIEMYVAAKDGRQLGIEVDLSEQQLKTLAQDEMDLSVEEMLAEVEKMPPAEQADLIINMVAEAMARGNEAEFERGIRASQHDPDLWDVVKEKALDLLVSQGRSPKRPLGPPGMRGFLWIAKLPEGPRMCARCGETWIPINEAPGMYPGAMSRIRVGRGRPATETTAEYASRCIEICSPCGQDEAMGRGLVPIEEWPIGKGEEYYDNRYFTDAMRDAIRQGRVQLQNEETGELVHSDGTDIEVVSMNADEVKLKIGTGDGTPVVGKFLDEDGDEINLTGKDNE